MKSVGISQCRKRSAPVRLLPFLLGAALALSPLNELNAQKHNCRIQGHVVDDDGEPLFGANVLIKELRIGATTNIEGFFVINNLRPGTYTLEISYVGYEKVIDTVAVGPQKMTGEARVCCKRQTFNIGGIEVTAERDLMPDDVETKTTITADEIEHYQA
ncbi:MAG: hypothetical protein GF419_10035, partial [Ignavibacteriales bacterium]|nr:hypothetical protein [Ignavibacteriales bacterium]